MVGKRSRGYRGVVWLLSIMIVIALTGCGGATAKPAATSAPPSPTGTAPAPAVPASPLSKLPATWSSSDELYAALAKLSPEEQQQAILEGAKKEGKAVFYSAAQEEVSVAWKKGFEAKYPGVTVEVLRAKESDLIAKLQAEAAAKKQQMDVAYGGVLQVMRDSGIAAKHFGVGLADYPKAFRGEDWVAMETLTTVLTYNTDLVKPVDAPKTLMELLDPKWKGKVHIDVNPATFLSGLILKWGEPKTRDWLKRLVEENQAVIRSGHTQAAGLLAAGEFAVSTELYTHTTEELRNKKAPIDWVVSEVVPMEINPLAINKQAPHPFAAMLFLDYMASKEGHTIGASFGRQVARPDVSFKYPRLEPLSVSPSASIISPDNYNQLYPVAEKLIAEIITPRVKGQ